MDFTAYFTAGKTLNNNLNPYVNYVQSRWDLWDGFASFKHSRFLYPPLVAVMFQPIASVSYINAKYIWNFFNLTCFLVSILILLKITGLYHNLNKSLISLILAFNFFPFIALLERGQVDCLTLLLILCGFALNGKSKKNDFFAGLLFGFASLFKLYTLLIIPFLFLNKKYRVLYGYLTGIVLIVILTFSLCGTQLTKQYAEKEFNRIAKFGSGGTSEMQIPVWILQSYFPMTPTSISMIDGRMYLSESISFNSKASFVRLAEVIFDKTPFKIPNSIISGFVFLLLFAFIYYYDKKYNFTEKITNNLIYLQAILIIITLSSPYTWVMNLIWLLPVAFILTDKFEWFISEKKYLYLLLLIAGFLLIALPDNLLLTKNVPIVSEIFKVRFILGQIIILIFLVLMTKVFFTKFSIEDKEI